jgi:hypothetical protein
MPAALVVVVRSRAPSCGGQRLRAAPHPQRPIDQLTRRGWAATFRWLTALHDFRCPSTQIHALRLRDAP